MSGQTFKIKSYSAKELRNLYDVSHKTFSSWLKPIKDLIGIVEGKKYSPKQVKIIVEHLGEPDND